MVVQESERNKLGAIIKSHGAVLHCIVDDIWLTICHYFIRKLLKYRETLSSFAIGAGKDGRKEGSYENTISSM